MMVAAPFDHHQVRLRAGAQQGRVAMAQDRRRIDQDRVIFVAHRRQQRVERRGRQQFGRIGRHRAAGQQRHARNPGRDHRFGRACLAGQHFADAAARRDAEQRMLHRPAHVAIDDQHLFVERGERPRQRVERQRLALALLRAGDQDGARQAAGRRQQQGSRDRGEHLRWLRVVAGHRHRAEQRQVDSLGQRLGRRHRVVEDMARAHQQQPQRQAPDRRQQHRLPDLRREGPRRRDCAVERLDAPGLEARLRRHVAIALQQAVVQHAIGFDRPLIHAHLHAAAPRRLRVLLDIGDLVGDLLFAAPGDVIFLPQRRANAARHLLRLVVQRRQPRPRLAHFRVRILAELPFLDQRGARLRPLRHQLLHRAIAQHFGQRVRARRACAFPALLRRDPFGQRLRAQRVELRQPAVDRAFRRLGRPAGVGRVAVPIRALLYRHAVARGIDRQLALGPLQVAARAVQLAQQEAARLHARLKSALQVRPDQTIGIAIGDSRGQRRIGADEADADHARLARQLHLQPVAQQGNDSLLLHLPLALAAAPLLWPADAHAFEEGGRAHQRQAARHFLGQRAAAQHFQLGLHRGFDIVVAGARRRSRAGRAGGHILHLHRRRRAIIGRRQQDVEQGRQQAQRHGDEQDDAVPPQHHPVIAGAARQPRAHILALRSILPLGHRAGHQLSPSSAMNPAASAGTATSAPPKIALARDRPTISWSPGRISGSGAAPLRIAPRSNIAAWR